MLATLIPGQVREKEENIEVEEWSRKRLKKKVCEYVYESECIRLWNWLFYI